MRVLYVIYWGATEPLGTAGTVPTVAELASVHGEDVYLVSYDKPHEYAAPDRRAAVERILDGRVKWKNLVYHKHPLNISTGYDIARGIAYCTYCVLRHRIDVVHGRTFVGALIGAILKTYLPVRFVCHPDGFWPEERVDDRIWNLDSFAYQLAKRLHWWTYRSADAIIVLSTRSRDMVAQDPVVASRGTPITVLHTSVDTKRFPTISKGLRDGEPFRIAYLGSMGGRYASEELFRFFAAALEEIPEVRFRIISVYPRERIVAWAEAAKIPASRLELYKVTPPEVPALLAECHAGVFFLQQGLSNFGTSATKVGEYLATGLPVAVTPISGDFDLLVAETRTGVVVARDEESEYRRAARELVALSREPGIGERCRRVAEREIAMDRSAAVQAAVHQEALKGASRSNEFAPVGNGSSKTTSRS